MSNKESTSRTLKVALAVSLVSSVFVAGAAVSLKPLQTQNRLLDKQRSIAAIAGMGGRELPAAQVRALFGETIKARLVNLETGEFADDFDAVTFDPLKAAKDPQQSVRLSKAEDVASIKRRERFTTVYMIEDAQGGIETLILPIRGYGLWSTLHGFMALKGDLNTVVGLGFHQHAETPGLGGEVDNPRWRNQWAGKRLFDDQGQLAVEIVKGTVDPQASMAAYQVDGLAGATLTSNGVNNLLHFWLGEQGFGPFLAKLRSKEA
ncbi:Na(+)-translocating NADH-quinone reductase subunit C [Thauera mechernichensis]|uniref:Na(+)-translocating NADH-quinone reductase subunit C n=1 Tax=Thauera mechernichensis TaxID=82788 RepID=A0ABW3WBJ0_9RHOO|nr:MULTISPECIES: Na(+)-translocating NADH-quinone reductase subunit C [Thauera]ENO76936.1 Na(+)-translocating NADH-quinone reductase subunit C [Thauera sp. 27]ENO93861.1 Na(+)-translocating NADH-quinone reductase subunit C [Thauera sp. 28]MDG3064154.1 Na(+)-translocating NADH-quinone reductase subunit C [Thauera mechernichensis]WBL63734.1 Na(+)-translocating NADH-quinone reductase subunit C [Thauera sp. WB-2]HAG75613.1 NADH:ubiquinone reductase (Na(+)-transporting) subunit C [Thauera sp.]